MKITNLHIPRAIIGNTTHSQVKFSNGKATVESIMIHFVSDKFIDKFSGNISLHRKEARKLIKMLESELKVRNTKQYLAWNKRRNNQ